MAREREELQANSDAGSSRRLRLPSIVRAAGAWVRRKPLAHALIVALPLLALVGASAWGLRAASEAAPEAGMPEFLEALDGNDLTEAQAIAQRLASNASLGASQQGLVLYVRGARVVSEASAQIDDDERRRLFSIAAGYFQQAREQGLPSELQAQAFSQAAACLSHAGRYAACVRFLERGLDVGVPPTAETHRLLAKGYARLPNPQWEAALAQLDRYLAEPQLALDDRRAAALDHVEILLGLDRDEEARQVLASLPARDPAFLSRVQLLQARLALRSAERLTARLAPGDEQAAPAVESLSEAKKLLEEVQQREGIDRPERRQADYLICVCLRDSGELRDALKQFSAARRLHAGTPSGLAAGLGEAELLQHEGRDAEALESYRRLLSETPPPSDYSNPWVTFDGFRARLLAAYANWLGRKKWTEAIALCRALPPVFPADRAMLLRAEAHAEWANQLAAQVEARSPREAPTVEREARQQCRLAGVAYARLALMRTTSREYPDDLWRSAEWYLKGRDFHHAARVFRLYLDQEGPGRRADAQAMLGESLMALGELEQALAAFQSLIEGYPHHPATYRARYLAAQTHLEMGDLAAAQKLLRENLEHELLTPQSLEWRDSLFLLGDVLYRRGKILEAESRQLGVDGVRAEGIQPGLVKLRESHQVFRQAAATLEEALARYPDAPQSLLGWRCLAEAYREAAKYPRKRIPTIELDATRNAAERELREDLTHAVTAYGQLIERLTRRERSGELNQESATALTSLEQGMLRNAYFGRADALFDLGRYDEAIRAYTLAANRYQNHPAALEAFLQIASCHRRRQRPAEARGVLEQAKVVLKRISPSTYFQLTPRYDRKQWEELLDLLIVN